MANNIWQFLAGGITAFTAAGKLKTKKQPPAQNGISDSSLPTTPDQEPETSLHPPTKTQDSPILSEPSLSVSKLEEVSNDIPDTKLVTPQSVKIEPSSLPASPDETLVSAEKPSPEPVLGETPQVTETLAPAIETFAKADAGTTKVEPEAARVEATIPESVEKPEEVTPVALAAEMQVLTPSPEALPPQIPDSGSIPASEPVNAVNTPEIRSSEPEFRVMVKDNSPSIATLSPSKPQLDQLIRQSWNNQQPRTGKLIQRYLRSQWQYGVALSDQQVIVWEPNQPGNANAQGQLAMYPLTSDYLDAMAVDYLPEQEIFQNILQSITTFHQQWNYAEGWNDEHWARLVTTGEPISYQVKESYAAVGIDRPDLFSRPEAKQYLQHTPAYA